jgi:type IV pilus assembly protein PilM
MSRSGGRLCVDEVGYALVDRNLVNSDPVMAHASAVREALANMPVPNCYLVAALPGQTVVIRYPRLGEKAKANLDEAVQREAGQNIPYDLTEVQLDWSLLEELKEADETQIKVLLVAAKHEVIDSRIQVLNAAELACSVLDVDSLALADAAEVSGMFRAGETVALLNIGLTSASIHFVKDGVSNFIRDVSWGARELMQAIAKDRRCDLQEAERLLQEMGHEKPAPPPEPAPAETPKAMPLDDPFGEPVSAASLLDPLEDEMTPAARPAASALDLGHDQRDLREVLAVPLTRVVSEVRRSFDYYEHQLYERPVDRLLLCGGAAALPLLAQVLNEELGVESVEVANPASGTLFLGDDVSTMSLREHPAQFMVAIGLAARGMADL